MKELERELMDTDVPVTEAIVSARDLILDERKEMKERKRGKDEGRERERGTENTKSV